TRYRTPTTSHGGTAASGHARNRTHNPAHTTTTTAENNHTAPFDPWCDTDPPDPGASSQTRPPGDPTPGQPALHHANPPAATTTDDRDRDRRPPVMRSTEPRTGPPCARPG
ncbi:hypothetical protein ACFPJ1_09155, partial [Kribbella qitaiheensis]|uniref:hypothetical protein n=1 Tax=Kribbella qitaiheensis TaxID=1544730 RepID=UPI003610CAFF